MAQHERTPRRSERLKHRVVARFQATSGEQSGIVTNLSELGLFIQTRHLLKPGSEITMTLDSGKTGQIAIAGKVAYSQMAVPMSANPIPGGMGVELRNPPDLYKDFVTLLKG